MSDRKGGVERPLAGRAVLVVPGVFIRIMFMIHHSADRYQQVAEHKKNADGSMSGCAKTCHKI